MIYTFFLDKGQNMEKNKRYRYEFICYIMPAAQSFGQVSGTMA